MTTQPDAATLRLFHSQPHSIQNYLERIQNSTALWYPVNAPQWQAILSNVDEIFYGGAAGGGKTDLIIGSAIELHQRSLILRRESTQLRGIIDRSREILDGTSATLNEVTGIWRNLPTGGKIELSGCKNEADKRKFQGRPHDLIAFDEATEFLESQVTFIIGWARTEDPEQHVRIIFTGNPPTSAEGQWIIRRFAPWLDDTFADRAEPGEVRWVAMLDGREEWRGVVIRGPLYPLNSLMTQGFVHAVHGTAGKLGDDAGEIRDEIRSFFASGTAVQELYVTPQKMTGRNWDDLAEAARWAHANADVLVDTHWVGGDPDKGVYGWASWNRRQGILALRNPYAAPARIAVDIAKAFELPDGAAREYTLRSPWKDDADRPPLVLSAGKEFTFELKPFEVLVFDAAPR